MTLSKPHTLQAWYLRYRREYKPKQALFHAKLSAQVEFETLRTLEALSPASKARIESFVDDFIRSPDVEGLTSDRDSDFINEPERAERCYDAAEFGADGKTHFEVIDDWRDAFSNWLSDRAHGGSDSLNRGDRFGAAVRARFALTEIWHDFNGSLEQEIG